MLLHLFHARRRHNVDAAWERGHLYLNIAPIKFSAHQHVAKFVARLGIARRGGFVCRKSSEFWSRQQNVEDTLARGRLGLIADSRHFLLTHHLDRDIGQFLDDGIHLAPDIADLGELRGFNLYKGSVGQPCQTARDLGLATTRGPNHQNVLWSDLVTKRFIHLSAAPAIAQRDGNGALGRTLAHDVLVQLLDDLVRRHSGSSSMVSVRLV